MKKIKTNVIIKLQFSAIHSWPKCNIEEVEYLKFLHRHVFHVTMKFPVAHSDRNIEFISMKDKVSSYIRMYWEGTNLGSSSCETLAAFLMNRFPPCNYVSVFEDDENGAEIEIDI